MISVYYNQKYGFLIVPNAIERFMGCYISIEPTIEIMAEETIDKIGCAIRKGIKIAESSPKVDESQLNNFWKQTKYKSFPTFSKNYQRIDLKQNGDELEIRRWERNNRGGYSRKTEEKDYINLNKNMAYIIRTMVNSKKNAAFTEVSDLYKKDKCYVKNVYKKYRKLLSSKTKLQYMIFMVSEKLYGRLMKA